MNQRGKRGTQVGVLQESGNGQKKVQGPGLVVAGGTNSELERWCRQGRYLAKLEGRDCAEQTRWPRRSTGSGQSMSILL